MRKVLNLFTVLILLSSTSYAQYADLYSFFWADQTGAQPDCTLISDSTFLYGVASGGGITASGTIFKIKPDGSGFAKVFDFGWDARYPVGSLVSDETNFYGMTRSGGVSNNGTIYKVQQDGTGFDTLKSFTDTIYGLKPYGTLLLDSNYLYGTTSKGGAYNLGTLFKIMTDGSNYVKLLDFDSATTGNLPLGELIIVGPYIYGITNQGGNDDWGFIYRIKKDGSDFETILDLDGVNNGARMEGGLLYIGNFLYGMTTFGGINSQGTIFRIDTAGNNYSKFFDFDNVANGGVPYGSLIFDGTYLYGMTSVGGTNYRGTIFRIFPDGSGFNQFYDFEFAPYGCNPRGSLYSDGQYLYGTTHTGGAGGYGTVFRYNCETIGIDEIGQQENIVIFPNPTEGELNLISSIDLNNSTIEILDMLGKSVLKRNEVNLTKGSPFTLDLSNFSAGSYILQIDDYKKIIIKQ